MNWRKKPPHLQRQRRNEACSAARMSPCWATTGRGYMRRCARRSGSAPSWCRSIRMRRPTRSRRRSQSANVTHVFAENQEQVDKLLEILPRCPRCNASSTTRTAACATTSSGSLSATPRCCSRAGNSSPKADFLQAEVARGNGQDTAFLLFTSGTTGPAKGVVLTHASLIDRARIAAAMGELKITDVAMAYLAARMDRPEPVRLRPADGRRLLRLLSKILRHHAGRYARDGPDISPGHAPGAGSAAQAGVDAGGGDRPVQSASLSGSRAWARPANRGGRQDASFFTDRLKSVACDTLIGGPLRDVIGMSQRRVAYTAGDATDPELLMFFRALGINLKQLYGSTETGFFVAMQRDGQVKPDTVGPAVKGVELKFTAQREILVRSPGIFRENHPDPVTTAQAQNAEGWFHTGDAGCIGKNGQLRIIDRIEYVGALKDGSSPRQN